MKTCPTCGRGFSDDLSFCLEDGSRLPGSPTIGLPVPPTEQYRLDTNRASDISEVATIVSRSNAAAKPTPKQFKMSAVDPASRMGCIVTVGQVSVVLLLVFGIGIAGIFYNFSRGSELASSGPDVYNTSSRQPGTASNANKSSNITKIAPTPAATGQPSQSDTSNASANSVSVRPTPFPVVDTPKTISLGVLNSTARSLPKPPYPAAARAVRAEGEVRVQVLIGETGRVVSANAVSGHPLLRGAAVQAARSAIFNPTILAGRPVKVSGVIVYNFAP